VSLIIFYTFVLHTIVVFIVLIQVLLLDEINHYLFISLFIIVHYESNETANFCGFIFVQTINILIVNQSVIDMCASFFMLLTAVAEVDGTRMSCNSIYDQFVCRMWLTKIPLWSMLNTSTCNILLTALERYAAVIYHVWYHNKVRTVSATLTLQCFYSP